MLCVCVQASVAIQSSVDITGTVSVSLQSLADALATVVNGGEAPEAGVLLPEGQQGLVSLKDLEGKSWFNQFLSKSNTSWTLCAGAAVCRLLHQCSCNSNSNSCVSGHGEEENGCNV